jgi:hypothetical protein
LALAGGRSANAEERYPKTLDKQEWEFFWQEWASPETTREPDFVGSIYGGWAGRKLRSGEVLPVDGYGTFRTVLRGIPSDMGEWTVDLSYLFGAATGEAFDANTGRLLTSSSSGIISKSPEGEVSSRRFLSLSFLPPEHGEVVLIVKISSFNRRWSGFWSNLESGPARTMKKISGLLFFIEIVSMGILIAIGISNFTFWLLNKEHLPHLWLSLASFAACLRVLGTSESMANLFEDKFYMTVIYRIDFLSMPLLGFFALFMSRSFPVIKFMDRFMKIYILSSFAIVISLIFADIKVIVCCPSSFDLI